MSLNESTLPRWSPGRPFYIGLALVLLATWIPYIPDWKTFIHMWRADLAAALFLIVTLVAIAVRRRQISFPICLSSDEIRFILLPLAVFIVWSGLSTVWAGSPLSAFHHTAVWTAYLLFYLLFRYALGRATTLRPFVVTITGVLLLFAIPAVIEFVPLASLGSDGLWLRVRYAKNGEQVVTILALLVVVALRLAGRAFYAAVAAIVMLWLLVYCTSSRVNLALFAGVMAATTVVVFGFSRFHLYRRKILICVLCIAVSPLPLYLVSLSLGSAVDPLAERLNASEANAYSSDFRLFMNSVSLEMIAARPVGGVGGDNYGLEFNGFREDYSVDNPNDPRLAYGEAGYVGHAHNEFLQIAAELGIVGVGIFAWFLVGIGIMASRILRSPARYSLLSIGAVVGLFAFLASSLVTSYSFRLVQNGIIFFFVLAVASKQLLRENASEREHEVLMISPRRVRSACALGVLMCVGLAAYSAMRVTSAALAGRANNIRRLDDAMPLYKIAMALDEDNPDVRQNVGIRLLQRGRYAEAVPYLESAIDIGRATSADFSYLASAQSLGGDEIGAELTMRKAATYYPRSAFVLTRYSELLESNGKHAEAAAVFERAKSIDERAAITWRGVITRGPKAVSEMAARDKDYMQVMQLMPTGSVYAVVAERYLKHPEEQRFSMLKISVKDDE
jgi:O-antigen ligase